MVSLGCYGESPETEEADGSGDFGGGEETAVTPPVASSSTGSQRDEEEEGFDPCPEVTYVLWESEGVRYVVTLEVFCEPVQNLNLGCPPPPIVR